MKPLQTILSLLWILSAGCDELGVKTTPYVYDTGTEDTTEEAPSMPPAILRERRDLETALYRI